MTLTPSRIQCTISSGGSPLPTVSSEYQTLSVPLPDLSHLTQAELVALRSLLTVKAKEARKESVKTLSKIPIVKDLWMKLIGLPSTASDETRAEIMNPLNKECLRYPEAFLVHAWANSLRVLECHVWDEILKRSKEEAERKGPKKHA